MTEQIAGITERIAWLCTPERHQAAWSMSIETIGVGVRRSGNRAEPAGKAVQAGRALARVDDRSVWGGLDYLAGDALVAEYDPKDRLAWLKDSADERTPGVAPWDETGTGAQDGLPNIRHAKPLEAIVARAAAIGPGMKREHVLFTSRAHLIAHHRPQNPPINSTPISDPGAGNGDWTGHLHNLAWVRPFPKSFCGGANPRETASSFDPDDQQLYSALLNFTKSAGDNTGWGAAHFSKSDALLSAEGYGFAHPADDGSHRLAILADGLELHEGGLHIGRAKFGDTDAGVIFSPAEFVNRQWAPGAKGPFIQRVEWREDFNAIHDTRCGTAAGMKKWMAWSDIKDYGDPAGKPTVDSGGEKSDPGGSKYEDPGGSKHNPPTMITTPKEIEAPSGYGHPRPDGPDKPGQPAIGGTPEVADGDDFHGAPWGGSSDKGPQYSLARELEDLWNSQLGFSEGKFLQQPITGHLIAGAVYENSTPAEGKLHRWRPVKSQLEHVGLDDFGMVTGRTPAFGPGHYTFAGSDVLLSDLYAGVNVPESAFNDFSLGVFAVADASGNILADGRFGMGHRLPDSAYFASGFDLSLDFGTDADNPDTVWTPRDETGAAGSGRFVIEGGTHIDDYLLVGAEGVEPDAIEIDNATVQGRIRASDFGTKPANIIVHQHSTTVAPKFYLSRSNSNSASHAAVTNGMALGEVFGLGWNHSTPGYRQYAGMRFTVDISGTVGENSAPGRIEFLTTPDGSVTPAVRWTIRRDGLLYGPGDISAVNIGADVITATQVHADELMVASRFELANGFYIQAGPNGGMGFYNDGDNLLAEFGDSVGGTGANFDKVNAEGGFDPPYIALDLSARPPAMPTQRTVKTFKRDAKGQYIRLDPNGPAEVESVEHKPVAGIFIRDDGKVCVSHDGKIMVLAVEKVEEA